MKRFAHKKSPDSSAFTICKENNSEGDAMCDAKSALNGAERHTKKDLEKMISEDDQAKNIHPNVVNAFQFMMDNRHKVIGRNSPGKEAVDDNKEDTEQNKKKLATRKVLLNKWAASKGTNKRKNEESERDQFISYTLEKRAKRMKKLLTQNNKKVVNEDDSDFENNKKIKKRKEKTTKKLDRNVKENEKENKKRKLKVIDDDDDELIEGFKNVKKNSSEKSDFKSQKSWTMKLKLNIDGTNNSNLEENATIEDQDVKLAPLFTKTSKQNMDKAALKARKEFLNSGLPKSLLKKTTTTALESNLEENYAAFPSISHVRPNPTNEELTNYPMNFWDLPEVKLPSTENDSCNNISIPNFDELRSVITRSKQESSSNLSFSRVTKFKKIVKDIKNTNLGYPVYKAFKILRQKHLDATKIETSKKRGRKKKKQAQVAPQSLPWVEKYKPSSSNEIFGNISSATELKKWLCLWVAFKKEINTRKRSDSTSSDEFDLGDSNNTENILPGNGMILVGPHGSGKTASLYAICKELDINVLELNASSKRTGKRLLQEIQEATQSHQVRKSQINSFLQPSSASAEVNVSKMCLLLVEDVDLVFEQDEGFLGALSQILLVSKRPVVMTTADSTCLHLQKFTAQYRTIPFAPMSSKTLGGWLQMVCLVEGCFVEKESLCNLLEFNKGDARKTLLQLEFWVTTGGNVKGKYEVNNEKRDDELVLVSVDESSNDSYFKLDEEETEEAVETHQYSDGEIRDYNNYEVLFWNLFSTTEELKFASTFLDATSLLSAFKKPCNTNSKEQTRRFWETSLKDSLSLNDSYEMQMDDDFGRDFAETVSKLIFKTDAEDLKINSTERIKWRIQRHSSDEALVQIVPLSSHIDRRSVATDYLPALRNIAKTEAFRFSTNSKRGNRFYHYLRGLGLDVNDACFKTACETFKLN